MSKSTQQTEQQNTQNTSNLLGHYSIDSMQSIFSEFDRDQNGFLSIEDWREVFVSMQVKVTDAEIAEIMKLCDHDQSGCMQINTTQFMRSLIDATGGQSNHPEVSKLVTNRKERNSFTSNNYGLQIKDYHKGVTIEKMIQDNELKSGLYETRFILDEIMSKNGITTNQIAAAFEKCLKQEKKMQYMGIPENHITIKKFFKYLHISKDTNSFKKLTKHLDAENTGLIQYRQPIFRFYLRSDATTQQKVDFSFKVCDNDNSGLIDFPELLQILLLTHPLMMTDRDAVRLFKKTDFLLNQCDIDKNGELDKKEYLKMAQQFGQLMFP